MQNKLWKMINVVLALEVSKGHLKWKISELARQCGVSRSLVYYHLGSSKTQIVDFCFSKIADEFYGLSEERMALVRAGKSEECLNLSREMFQANPEFMIFYLKWRVKKSPLQQKMMEIEKRYHAKLKMIFPKIEPDEILALHALIQGIVSCPFMTPNLFKRSLAMIRPPKPTGKLGRGRVPDENSDFRQLSY
jgi:AcrR family transcriptional regulator